MTDVYQLPDDVACPMCGAGRLVAAHRARYQCTLCDYDWWCAVCGSSIDPWDCDPEELPYCSLSCARDAEKERYS